MKTFRTLLKINDNNYINPMLKNIGNIIKKEIAREKKENLECGDYINNKYVLEDVLEGIEISVIHKDNEHGHNSYGWGDKKYKLIITNCHSLKAPSVDVATMLIKGVLKTAISVRNKMNKK